MLRKYSAYVLCLLISILVVTLYLNDFSPLRSLEWKIQDLMYTFRGEENFTPDIILVDIDDRTLSEFGEWPWHRDKVADLLAAIGSGEPKTMLVDILFEPDINEDTLGYTKVLAGQMSWIKGIILPYEFSRAEFMTGKVAAHEYLSKSSIEVNNDIGILNEEATLQTYKAFLPPEQLCEFAAGLGFKYHRFDDDKKVRWQPLVTYYDGYYYPSVSLLTAANYIGVQPALITVYEGEKIKLGGLEIPTDDQAALFINYNKPGRSFSQVSAADILTEKYDLAGLKNKLVIVSITGEFLTDYFQTPVARKLLSAEITANVVENIIHSNFIKRLDSSPGRDIIILFALGAIFAFVLPRVSLLYRMIILLASMFVLANLNFIAFNSYNILARPLYVGLELFLLTLVSPIMDNELLSKLSTLRIGFAPSPQKTRLPKAILPDTNLSRPPLKEGKPLQQQAEVIETRRPMPPSKKTRTDMFAAETVSERARSEQITIADIPMAEKEETVAIDEADSKPAEAPPPDENQSFAEASFKPLSTPAFGSDSRPIKSLGRYRVLEEIGKGAMGMVYKGVDPAINRNVALKTIRLDFVNDPQEMEELKERLNTEARAAGKLSHPNIVTIYDVGTEGNLQYIAMEFLEGRTLEEMLHRKVKFNYRIIAQIISQICSALDFAHQQNIVHRDIKPANIMVLNDYKVKVMDFGIARVDTSSMTRTGIAMGTPNYIAPELLQGKHVDKRCDIFSLGVLIYELLLNRRPFRGDNLTSLIYSIVNTEPEPPSKVDRSIPHLFDRVIDRALRKDPVERYQNASEIARALAGFLDSFTPKSGVIL